MTSQEEVFVAGEADRWFRRNRGHLTDPAMADGDLPLRFLDGRGLRPSAVLEVGCANGWRRGLVMERYGSSCSGLDPSAEAIADGRLRYPRVRLLQGVASSLPFPDAEFDLVIVNFVFHWIGRDQLVRAIAEIDRVLANGGHLIVSDFLPDAPTRRAYHHLPEADVWTYKQDYAAPFLATRLYSVVDSVTFDHDARCAADDIPPDRRGACVLLRKSFDGAYR